MKQLSVGLGDRSYSIDIASGCLLELGAKLATLALPRRVVIVTNTTVSPLYAAQVKNSLTSGGFEVETVTVPDGENYKTAATLNDIFTRLIEIGCDRSTTLVALGGGVVGDMAGFAAATFMRGIPFVQVPTTLLAQVDSSVGGKTAINHPLGKNMIGAFYQPRYVLIDVETLQTLAPRHFVAGLAEVIKYGMIYDGDFFDWIELHIDDLLAQDAAILISAITRCCQIKAAVVEEDEKETALRAILNYGHTFGHAVEQLSGYGEVLHGEAVAIGMVVAAKISCHLGLCTAQQVERLVALLLHCGLPVAVPGFPQQSYLGAMCRDKKVQDGVLRMVLNRGIGAFEIRCVDNPAALFEIILS